MNELFTLPSLPEPVQWFEGMLLSPQHFQQNNLYFELSNFHQLRRVSPYYWGVNQLQFDQSALSDNRLVITKLHAVMPDGTIVQHGNGMGHHAPHPDTSDAGLTINLAELKIEKPGAFLIYVALPRHSDACASDNNSQMKRYDSVNMGRVIDDNDAHNQVDLVRLRARLHLLPESMRSSNYSDLAIAKVELGHDGNFQSLPYIPAQLFINDSDKVACPSLYKQISQTLGDLRKKATQLRNFIGDTSAGGFVSANQKQKIHYLCGHLPLLEVLLKSQTSHPYTLYQALVTAASNMAILTEELIPRIFPVYEHNQLQATFAPVLAFMQDIIKSIRLDVTALMFELNERDEYRATLSSAGKIDWSKIRLSFKLAPGVNREQLIAWVENAYICSDVQLEALQLERVLGAERKHMGEFHEFRISEAEDEVLFEADLTQLGADQDQQNPPQTLVIVGSDFTINRYAPAAINWYLDSSTEAVQ